MEKMGMWESSYTAMFGGVESLGLWVAKGSMGGWWVGWWILLTGRPP